MGKKSGPKPPDPAATAQAQAEANRIDQFGPFGSLVFSGPNNSTATTTLSPNQQAILDLLETGTVGLGQRAVDQIGTLPSGSFDLSGLPAVPTDTGAVRTAAENATFARGLRLLDPVFETQERRLESRLANQGIPVGSEAFARDFEAFNTGRDQALLDLADRSVLAGGAEATREISNAIAARQQGIGERVTERQVPLNEILSLLGLQQVQSPISFGPGSVDVLGSESLSMQAQMAKQQAQQQMLGGIFGLGGTLGAASILASSRDFKTDGRPVEGVLEALERVPVERWRYRRQFTANGAGEHIGPYAEDFNGAFGLDGGRHIRAVDAIGVLMAAVKELSAEVKALKEGR